MIKRQSTLAKVESFAHALLKRHTIVMGSREHMARIERYAQLPESARSIKLSEHVRMSDEMRGKRLLLYPLYYFARPFAVGSFLVGFFDVELAPFVGGMLGAAWITWAPSSNKHLIVEQYIKMRGDFAVERLVKDAKRTK